MVGKGVLTSSMTDTWTGTLDYGSSREAAIRSYLLFLFSGALSARGAQLVCTPGRHVCGYEVFGLPTIKLSMSGRIPLCLRCTFVYKYSGGIRGAS